MQIKIKMFLIGLQADTLELEHPYLKGTHYKPSFTTMENNDVEFLHLSTFQTNRLDFPPAWSLRFIVKRPELETMSS